jgi:hypothetical protein
VKFTLKTRTEDDAYQIASWHYPPPYDFYDMDQDPEDLAALLDPQTWREPLPQCVITGKLAHEAAPAF